MHPIELSHVSKQYRLGASDSLRDAIPALVRRWTGKPAARQENDEFWALRDVSFHVAKGENLAIVGHNGAGKSTVLKLLSKITTQTKGTIKVRGLLAALIELGGGFHPDLTGSENIYLQGTMLGLTHRQIQKHFDSIVAFSDLEHFLETPVKRYSSGMVVRLGFAVAAHVQPDILLLDEVLAVGDLSFQQKCFNRIAELKRTGTTMIFISHNLEAVQRLCDRVILMNQGRITAEGAPAEMLQRYREEVLSSKLSQGNGAKVESHDGPIQITRLELHDGNGQATAAIQTGEPLTVEIGFRAKQTIKDPAFRIAIERLDGLLCHATSSRQQGLTLTNLSGERSIKLEYPEVTLLPNLYQVIVEVFEGNNPLPVVVLRQGCFFQVTSQQSSQGAVHLEHRWSLNGQHHPA